MLALEKRRVIGERGIGAYFSVLSAGDIRDGRFGGPEKLLFHSALGGNAGLIIPRFGPTADLSAHGVAFGMHAIEKQQELQTCKTASGAISKDPSPWQNLPASSFAEVGRSSGTSQWLGTGIRRFYGMATAGRKSCVITR